MQVSWPLVHRRARGVVLQMMTFVRFGSCTAWRTPGAGEGQSCFTARVGGPVALCPLCARFLDPPLEYSVRIFDATGIERSGASVMATDDEDAQLQAEVLMLDYSAAHSARIRSKASGRTWTIEADPARDCPECCDALCLVCKHERCPHCIEDCDHSNCITWDERTGVGTKTHECVFPRCPQHGSKRPQPH